MTLLPVEDLKGKIFGHAIVHPPSLFVIRVGNILRNIKKGRIKEESALLPLKVKPGQIFM